MSAATWGLTVGIVFLTTILGWSQLRGKLDLADGFKDEIGRTSAGRICAVGAWIASTWYLMSHDVSDTLFLSYVGLWALLMFGSKGLDVIDKAVTAWAEKR